MANWENTYVYNGAWNAWQMDSKFPVQKDAPNGMEKPDAKNTYVWYARNKKAVQKAEKEQMIAIEFTCSEATRSFPN